VTGRRGSGLPARLGSGLSAKLSSGLPARLNSGLAARLGAGRDVEGRRPLRDERIPFRARIGVTGHRHIGNLAEVEAAVAQALQEIHEAFATARYTDVVFTILSSLAVGSDRLVVRKALDGALSAELGAVLPVARASYEQDFHGVQEREEFRELFECASAQIELESHHIPKGDLRDAAYDRAGHYIVEHSDVLIALWDGRDALGRGGTGDIVKYAKQRGIWVLAVPAVGLREELPLARTRIMRLADRRRKRTAIIGLHRIDRCNKLLSWPRRDRLLSWPRRDRLLSWPRRDRLLSWPRRDRLLSWPRRDRLLSWPRRADGKLRAERDRLAGMIASGASLQREGLGVLDWALARLAVADRRAVVNHRWQTLLAWSIHLLAALAVTAVAIQLVYQPHRPGWLVVEMLLVLCLLLAVLTARIVRFRDRWSGYRSLAEAIRSGMFIALCGLDDKPGATRARILGASDEAWFQRAFTQVWQSRPQVSLRRDEAPGLRAFLIEGWIDDQIKYHQCTARRTRIVSNLCTLLMSAIALATITVALLHLSMLHSRSPSEGALKLAALALPAFGGAVAGLREYGQLRLHQERSERAATRLRTLRGRMAGATTLASVRHLATEAQQIMVDETVDWYGVSEFQDLNIVL
jgi:hypothetical protein